MLSGLYRWQKKRWKISGAGEKYRSSQGGLDFTYRPCFMILILRKAERTILTEESWRLYAEEQGAEKLHEKLKEVDPDFRREDPCK